MGTVRGILGQSAPAALNETALYTCPSDKTATGEVIIANRGSSATYRISVSVNGAATTDKDYLAYDESIDSAPAKRKKKCGSKKSGDI